jgi:hypothetical protein
VAAQGRLLRWLQARLQALPLLWARVQVRAAASWCALYNTLAHVPVCAAAHSPKARCPSRLCPPKRNALTVASAPCASTPRSAAMAPPPARWCGATAGPASAASAPHSDAVVARPALLLIMMVLLATCTPLGLHVRLGCVLPLAPGAAILCVYDDVGSALCGACAGTHTALCAARDGCRLLLCNCIASGARSFVAAAPLPSSSPRPHSQRPGPRSTHATRRHGQQQPQQTQQQVSVSLPAQHGTPRLRLMQASWRAGAAPTA